MLVIEQEVDVCVEMCPMGYIVGKYDIRENPPNLLTDEGQYAPNLTRNIRQNRDSIIFPPLVFNIQIDNQTSHAPDIPHSTNSRLSHSSNILHQLPLIARYRLIRQFLWDRRHIRWRSSL